MKIRTVSLFNGMSCGKMALDIDGIDSEYYYSEIDKYANKLTESLYPDAIPLGDVRDIDYSKLPKIDLLIGGSPCQSFSFAGKRKGMVTSDNLEILSLEHYLQLKKDGFEFEGQSYLFWEFVHALKELKPTYFLLENVIMVEKWRKVLSRNVGIAPIRINSARVSAQSRDRYYWTNIAAESDGLFGDLACKIKQPKDKGILLRDILESDVPDKYFLSDKMLLYFSKRAANFNQGKVNVREQNDKATTLCASMSSCDISDNFVLDTKLNLKANQQKSNCFTAGGNSGGLHSDMDLIIDRQVKQLSNNNKSNGGTQPYQQDRIYDVDGISPALCKDKSDLLICHNIQTKVVVRKNDVDIKGLQGLLRSHKNMSCEQISLKLNIPKTKVEHYFRTDKSFAIPDSEIWFKLKELLNIKDNSFDLQITEFIEKPNKFDSANRAYDVNGKNATLTAASDGNLIFGADYRSDEGFRIRENGKTYCLDTGQTNAVEYPYRQDAPISEDKEKYQCLRANAGGKTKGVGLELKNSIIRRLTPREVLRLQTVPEHLIDKIMNLGISDTQIYKMAGNGWTVDVIAYIFSHLKQK